MRSPTPKRVACRADRVDDADDLVAGHDVGPPGRQVALGEVQVGAAHAAHRDADPDLARAGLRLGPLDERQRARRRSDPGRRTTHAFMVTPSRSSCE